MSETRALPDQAERSQAVDPGLSCIVQAPAGSGKTELLIQRYLRLLSVVEAPEEIVAITFTRKAAGEMRRRIESALRAARDGQEPAEVHRRLSYDFAQAALENGRRRNWDLTNHPQRLRIGTIDSLNAGLARRAPLSAGVTAQSRLAEDVLPYYRMAIRETLLLAADDAAAAEQVTVFLGHCDNRSDLAERYLLLMLQRRDQWLRFTAAGQMPDPDELRELFECSLRRFCRDHLEQAAGLLPQQARDLLFELLQYAAQSLREDKPDAPLCQWAEAECWPEPTLADIGLWRSLAGFLLTASGGWRKSVNRHLGFPPGKGAAGERKQQMVEMLARFSTPEHDPLRRALVSVQALPDARYSDSQWALINALWQVLPLLVAMLKNVFAEQGVTDYTEVAMEALDALETGDGATELRLQLDYQIRHLLLDEFQDTSHSQVQLIENLTEGWENEPDRSLFIVGDPMQSIYRFREAEVTLFLEAWVHGIGNLRLKSLRLAANFRSDPQVVGWFNRVFADIFPDTDDTLLAAVRFSPSIAMQDQHSDNGVACHLLPGGDAAAEADRVVELVRERLEEWATTDDRQIGILVRGRKHAFEIGRRLSLAGIDFTATGLEYMEEQSAVQDLLALTRAILHPADRIAWLACLRAPWCGLTLNDLHALAAGQHEICIPALANDEPTRGRLSPDGAARLSNCMAILQSAVAAYDSVALRDLVESTWHRLGGPATLASDSEQVMVRQYFQLLDAGDATGVDEAELLRMLREKTITRGKPDSRVAIMTIHKAKGLEFDTVILPGLSRVTRSSDKPPLLFHEFDPARETPGLVVAPIAGSDADQDPIHAMLWRLEKERERFELTRLIYVAVTRAKQRLHLLAGLTAMNEENTAPRQPGITTMLGALWPALGTDIEHAAQLHQRRVGTPFVAPVTRRRQAGQRETDFYSVPLRRLPADWQRPVPDRPVGLAETPDQETADAMPEFDWASATARHVGTVVHRWLQQISEEGIEHWDRARVRAGESALKQALRRAGVGSSRLAEACERTLEAIGNVLEDQHGRWILDRHAEARNEYPVVAPDPVSGIFRKHIIDRTFVAADDVRWIIDYKTGAHESRDIESFIRSEVERYRPQLNRYRETFAALEDRTIKTALYFPVLKQLVVVDSADATTNRPA